MIAELRQRLYAELGTRPIVLRDAAAAPSMEKFITDSKTQATASMGRLFETKHHDARASGAVFRELVKLMLDPVHDGVVEHHEVRRIVADPKVTVRVLKEHKALIYDVATEAYRFYSPAHRQAAEQMAAEQKAAEQMAAEQKAAEQMAAEQIAAQGWLPWKW